MAAPSELQRLATLFEGHPDVRAGQMFGSPCLKIRGKVFATQQEGFMVFKLPPDAHASALALAGAARWNPSGKRVLREWVRVPAEHHQSFHELAQTAAQFVGGKMTNLDLLLESFHRNARVNAVLLDVLRPEEYDLSDGKGGLSVAQILRHMAGFRVGWLWNISREYAMPLLDATQKDADGDPVWRWQNRPPNELADAFTEGDQAAVKAVQAHLASGEPFADPWKEGAYQSNPAHFLQHTIVHDSHHRGQIMTLLREGGRSKEEMDKLDDHWGIWRE